MSKSAIRKVVRDAGLEAKLHRITGGHRRMQVMFDRLGAKAQAEETLVVLADAFRVAGYRADVGIVTIEISGEARDA